MKRTSLLKKTLVFFLLASFIVITAGCLQALRISYSNYLLAAGAVLQFFALVWMISNSAGAKAGSVSKD